MKLAFATAHSLPDLHEDDQLLRRAFARRDVEVVPLVWTEPFTAAAFDGVIVRSCWDYVGDHAAFLQWALSVEQMGVPLLNNARAMRWNHDKIYLQELAEAGIPTVPTVYHAHQASGDELATTLRGKGWRDLVVKPAVSHNAVGMRRIHDWQHNADYLEAFAEPSDGAFIVQPLVTSVYTEGSWSLIGFARELSHAIKKSPVERTRRGPFVYGGAHRPSQPCDEARSLASEVLRVIPDHLFARVDMLRLGDQLVVSDVEMVEPFLHFADAPESADKLVDVTLRSLQR